MICFKECLRYNERETCSSCGKCPHLCKGHKEADRRPGWPWDKLDLAAISQADHAE